MKADCGVLARARNLAGATLAGGLLLAAAIILLPSASATAASPSADPTPAASAKQQEKFPVLERLFQREQRVLQREYKLLERATGVMERIQQRIAGLKAKGQDVAGLEKALADFKTGVAEAQSRYDAAKGALDQHAGFTADGKVTDRDQARATLKTAGTAERQVLNIIGRAGRELRRAVREYRAAQEANK